MSNSLRRRRGSNVDGPQGSVPEGVELNFAQRLLMANENAVTNIADLWVAAAMNVDNEDPFESDTELDLSDAESLDLDGALEEGGGDNDLHVPETPTPRSRMATAPHRIITKRAHSGTRTLLGSPRTPSVLQRPTTPIRLLDGGDASSPRRMSTNVPVIFSHSGVRTPPAVIDAQQLLLRTDSMEPSGAGGAGDSLPPIIEHRPLSQPESVFEIEKPPSLSSQLPVLIIAQYGLLALHTTTHDQVFMSYLVS
jgi:hypothetical protein